MRSITMRPTVFVAMIVLTFAACAPSAVAPPPVSTDSPSGSAASSTPLTTASPVTPPSVEPSSTPIDGASPLSAGAVPDAGVLYVEGADDRIWRYDGSTGALEAVWARSTFGPEAEAGVYVIGRHGGSELLGWDGAMTSVGCASGYVLSVLVDGRCAYRGDDGVYVKLPSDAEPRLLLPTDWGAKRLSWSPDGRRLLIVRVLRVRPGPGLDPGLDALWLMEPDGRLRELYRPSEVGVLGMPIWSPDGTEVVVQQGNTTSASAAADGSFSDTLLIDVSSGAVRKLGIVLDPSWIVWSPDGRLAFIRGGGRWTWWDKHLVIGDAAGSERVAYPGRGDVRVALAPSWGPHGELGWVSGPAVEDLSGANYTSGAGVGARSGMIEVSGERREVACGGGRVVEGLRWSADGTKLLLLCRVPGGSALPLELWLYRLGDGSSAPLVRDLLSSRLAGGFGYYGRQPAITSVAAWSLGARSR